jgi:hypothetical protein
LKYSQTDKFLITVFGSILIGCICIALLAFYFQDLPEWEMMTIIYSGLALVIGGTLFIGLKKLIATVDARLLDEGLEIRFRKHSFFYKRDLLIRWEDIKTARAYFESENNTYYYSLKTVKPKRNFSLQYPKGGNTIVDTDFWMKLKERLRENL